MTRDSNEPGIQGLRSERDRPAASAATPETGSSIVAISFPEPGHSPNCSANASPAPNPTAVQLPDRDSSHASSFQSFPETHVPVRALRRGSTRSVWRFLTTTTAVLLCLLILLLMMIMMEWRRRALVGARTSRGRKRVPVSRGTTVGHYAVPIHSVMLPPHRERHLSSSDVRILASVRRGMIYA